MTADTQPPSQNCKTIIATYQQQKVSLDDFKTHLLNVINFYAIGTSETPTFSKPLAAYTLYDIIQKNPTVYKYDNNNVDLKNLLQNIKYGLQDV